jgi:hypothetical protein
MKNQIAVVAAFALAAAAFSAAHGESRLRDSDDYNCNHGAPGAAATEAACYRLRNGSPADEEAWARQNGQPVAAEAGCPPRADARREPPAS